MAEVDFDLESRDLNARPLPSIDDVAVQKLLHYVKKGELQASTDSTTWSVLLAQLANSGKKPTAHNIKQVLGNDPDFVRAFRNTDVHKQAYQRYIEAVQRARDPAVQRKRREARTAMVEPRRGFMGCIATKVPPASFEECARNYDQKQYQDIEVVPKGYLKLQVYQKTGNPSLAPARSSGKPNKLPANLGSYIREHPEEYAAFLEGVAKSGTKRTKAERN